MTTIVAKVMNDHFLEMAADLGLVWHQEASQFSCQKCQHSWDVTDNVVLNTNGWSLCPNGCNHAEWFAID